MAEQGRRVSILGVPTSAGSHNTGQEKAPAAWRAAGLADGLRRAGLDVEDRGDLPATPFRAVPPVDGLRDVERVVAVAQQVAGEVAAIRADRRLYNACTPRSTFFINPSIPSLSKRRVLTTCPFCCSSRTSRSSATSSPPSC